MDANLDTLKREILEYLDSAAFVVFHGSPGGLEGLPMVLWDTEQHPDYQAFLEVAQKSGIQIVILATREFEADDTGDLLAQLDDLDLTREEQREYQSRLRELRIYEGQTCFIELAFDYHSRLYVYQVQPDWYQEFLGTEDEILSRTAGEDDGDEDDFGGYFSKN
ncbi:MAG: hypothetical protein LAP87_06735 [Acidobacteriia bacterium]|nr:hypothetical protein [Terriglobia bacterium]